MQKVGRGLQPGTLALERHLLRPVNPFGRVVEAICAHLEFVAEPFEKVRCLKLFLELLGPGNLPVVLNFHALGIVDDDSEITFLRQDGRDVQNRPKKNERQHAESRSAQRY